METLLFIITALVVFSIIIQIFLKPGKIKNDFSNVENQLQDLNNTVQLFETRQKEEFKNNREESSNIAKTNREELNNTLKDFKKEMSDTFRDISEKNQASLEKINHTLEEKLGKLSDRINENNNSNRESLTKSLKEFSDDQNTKFNALKEELSGLTFKTVDQLDKINVQAKEDSKQNRESITKTFKDFQDAFDKNVESFNNLQREKFGQLEEKQNKLVDSTEKKLEEMRQTVDEKLQKTLAERLGQSFDQVSKQLESVQKGLGEMQTLAQDVGGLKRVLSNVKMRGGIGEVQLAMLLEQILAPDQYETNVKTKYGSSENVEFAIKLPGREDNNETVWLPIDAKFPKDIYEQLQTAYDGGDIHQIESCQKALEVTIKKMARDIHEKYIDPPHTTDFGIMFLPFEGIYAEVVRKASLLEELQRDYKIIITGPTTLAAILNSLQMGFRTLAIQKRSSEVWRILGAVKKEFENFGNILNKAQNNIQTGLNQLDDVMGKRTRAIQRKLRGVEALSESEAKLILPEMVENVDEEE